MATGWTKGSKVGSTKGQALPAPADFDRAPRVFDSSLCKYVPTCRYPSNAFSGWLHVVSDAPFEAPRSSIAVGVYWLTGVRSGAEFPRCLPVSAGSALPLKNYSTCGRSSLPLLTSSGDRETPGPSKWRALLDLTVAQFVNTRLALHLGPRGPHPRGSSLRASRYATAEGSARLAISSQTFSCGHSK
jgi:hypothetical protein